MASNNFDGAVIIDNGVGSPLAPGGYYGFGRAQGADFSTGPRIYAGAGSPDGVLIAPMSSIYLQTNAVTGTLWVAADSLGDWALLATDVDVAVLQAEINAINGQIVTINSQIATMLASIAANTLAIAVATANFNSFVALLGSNAGAAHIGTQSGLTLQAQLDLLTALAARNDWTTRSLSGLNADTLTLAQPVPALATHIELQFGLQSNEAIQTANASLYLNLDSTEANYRVQRSAAANGAAVVTTATANALLNVSGSGAPTAARAFNFVIVPFFNTTVGIKGMLHQFLSESTTANVATGIRAIFRIVGATTDPISSLTIQATAATQFTASSVWRWRYGY